MGKRIDDLPLDDSPIDPSQQQDLFEPTDKSGADERDTPWYQFIGTIDDLLASGRYDWALDTLTGIRETVEARRLVTEGQRRAVTNIENRGESRRDDGPSGRRYEGFTGRR